MSNQLQVTGEIVNISEPKDVGKAKPYLKRTFALSDPTAKIDWPNWFVFEIGGSNVDKIDAHKVGDMVTVSFNLKGREWQGKWFSNTEAWKIDSVAKAEQAPASDGLEANIPF